MGGVQHGGTIAIFDRSNSIADLTSCTLSGNDAKQVRRHAEQEQCMKHLCMLRSVLVLGCCRMHARGVWEKEDDHARVFGVQSGGAIAIWNSNSRADLTSCTLSINQAKRVRRHANHD